MKIAVSGWDFEGRPPEEFYGFMSQLGVSYVELWPWNRPNSVSQLKEMLKQFAVQVACVNTTSQRRLLVHDAAEVSAIVRDSVELASALGAPLVNLYPGHRSDLDTFANMTLFASRLAPLLDFAAKRGVTLVVETHFDRAERGEDPRGEDFMRAPERTLALVRMIDHPNFGVTYDPCNLHIAGVEAWPYSYRVLAPVIRYVHVKNAVRFHEFLYGPPSELAILTDTLNGTFLPVPLAAGAVNWSGLLNSLVESGFDGFLCMEPHVVGRDVEAVIQQDLTFLRERVGPEAVADRGRRLGPLH